MDIISIQVDRNTRNSVIEHGRPLGNPRKQNCMGGLTHATLDYRSVICQ